MWHPRDSCRRSPSSCVVGDRRCPRPDVCGLYPHASLPVRTRRSRADRGESRGSFLACRSHLLYIARLGSSYAGGVGNYYRPLFLLWLRINDAVFGNQAWGWHLTTILAHVLATLLVYLLAWRLGIGRDVALLAALIFGLHPAHIEAVAWISGVTEPLLGIYLDCFVPWLRAVARRGSARAQMESHFPGLVCSRHAGERDCTDTSRSSACLRVDLWDGVGKTARGEEKFSRGAEKRSAKSGLTSSSSPFMFPRGSTL